MSIDVYSIFRIREGFFLYLFDLLCGLTVMPKISSDTQAGTYHEALEGVFKRALSLDNLRALSSSSTVDFVLKVALSDYAASNARYLLKMELLIAALNRMFANAGSLFRILLVKIFCAGHIGTGLVSRAFKFEVLIPKVYNLDFLCRFPPRVNTLKVVMRDIIKSDLENGGFFASTDARPEYCESAHLLLHAKGKLHVVGVHMDTEVI